MEQPRSVLLGCVALQEAGLVGSGPVARQVEVGTDEVHDRGPRGRRLGLVALHRGHIHRTEAVTVVDDVEVKGSGQLLGVVLCPPGPQLPTVGSMVASTPARPPDPGRRVNGRVSRPLMRAPTRPGRSVRSGGPPS